MPDNMCQWFQPASEAGLGDARSCTRKAVAVISVQITIGMHAHVHVCAQHRAEYRRRNAELRLGRGKR